jgi:pyruvate dehydrogenase E2 component (dihydrolipoamide acetyltransferase)
MPTPFIMPKVDMDQEIATIISWEKQEGDEVKQDEVVLSVETEKVAIDVTSPASGILAGIKFHEGDVVPVATVIAYILKPGETLADLDNGSPSALESNQATQRTVETGMHDPVVELIPPADKLGTKSPERNPGKIAATPAARRISNETGIPLESVKGSGPLGRIQADDVKKSETAVEVSEGGRQATLVPLVDMRAKIARKMQMSFQTAPHISETMEADVSHLESLKNTLNQAAQQNGQDKVSLTAILTKLVAWSLERNPYINSSLIEDKIHLWKEINIGIATALESGLIVPVVRDANKLSFSEMARKVNDLSLRARENRLELWEVQRGTFTITNLGMYGINHFRAIINPPENAILAVGAAVRKPIVIDEQDTVAVRPVISFTLSADHRVIDGVVAAKFLADLVKVVEHPEILLA